MISNEISKKKKLAEQNLSGELQKSVWSIVWRERTIRIKNISIKLGRSSDSVYQVLQKLIKYDMVQIESRGIYRVSESILPKEITK